MPRDEPMLETLRTYARERDREVMRLEGELAAARAALAAREAPPSGQPAPEPPADTVLHRMLEEHRP